MSNCKQDDFPAMNYSDIQKTGSSFATMNMNALRAQLYMQGIDYKDDATREELIALLKK